MIIFINWDYRDVILNQMLKKREGRGRKNKLLVTS